ncbi:MAG TPA: VOC family protein [Candidatus Binataceae bacterium]|nr:VOC family protein [Candidatus Binataceae bacterium]
MDKPFKVAELDHVVLRCRDQARALDFYTRIIGLHEERRVEHIGLIQLRAGTSLVDLIPAKEPRVEAGANVDHYCLGLDTKDLDATIAYLKSQGVELLSEPTTRYGARGNGLSIYIRDPEGNVVELKPLPS